MGDKHTEVRFDNLDIDRLLKLIQIENLLEEYEDIIDYAHDHPTYNIYQVRNKSAIINTDKEEASLIKAIKGFNRTATEEGIRILVGTKKKLTQFIENKEVKCYEIDIENLSKSYEIKKAYSYEQFDKWRRSLKDKLPKVTEDFKNKLLVPVSIAYTKGHDKGMKDLGLKALGAETMYLEGSAVPRLRAALLYQYLSKNVSMEMQTAIVEGMRKGEGIPDIAKRIRKVRDYPKRVKVAPITDPKTGKVIRKGYEYNMSSKRYSEIVARTEALRATNTGRLDSYSKSGVVDTVEWMAVIDKRTCEICDMADGTVYKLEDSYGKIPAHACCRCTFVVDKYKEAIT